MMTPSSRKNYKRRAAIRMLLLILLAIQFGSAAQAQQVPIVRIDPHSRIAQQTVPFDRYFYLLIPVDTLLRLDEVRQLSLYEVKRKTKANDPLGVRLASYRSRDPELQNAYFVDTPKDAGFKYLKVFIARQLRPNTHFSVALYLYPTADYFEKFNKINMELYRGDIDSAKKDYHELASNVSIKYSSGNMQGLWERFDKEDTDTIYNLAVNKANPPYHQYFLDSLQSLYQEISNEDTAILNNLERLADTLRSCQFHISELFGCNCQKDLIANELFSDSTKFLIPLQNLLNVPPAIRYFAAGKLNIQEFEPYDAAKDYDLKKRIDNLGRLKSSLVNISYFFHLSTYANDVPDKVKTGIYNTVLDALAAIDKRTKTLKDMDQKMRQRLNANLGLFSGELAFGVTTPFGQDIKTAAGNYIIADFGLAGAGTFVHNQLGVVLRPYLGVNFSFIPIDKSQPFSAIQERRFLHRLSAVLGLTTSPLTRQGTYDLLNNMSAVVGLAFRMTRGFRFTFGTLVYERDNPNPVLAPRVTVGPMIAVSLDLEIATWFNDLKSKLY